MILYNTTIIIDQSIDEQWLNWVRKEHIPNIISTGMFESTRLLKVINSPNEGITYCIQCLAPDLEKYDKYLEKFERIHHAEHTDKFGNNFVTFSTVMEHIPLQ